MFTQVLDALGGQSWVSLVSHAMIGSAWAVALLKIWQHRTAPMAHQAFAAACAIVLGEFTLIFSNHFPADTVTFFLAVAQLVMAIAMVKMLNWAGDLANEPMTSAEISGGPIRSRISFLTKTYATSVIIAIFAGIIYLVLTVIEAGHG